VTILATAVYDCMVFLQGAAKANGPAAACLDLVESGHVHLFLSQEILDEVRNVLTRPKIQKKFPALTDSRVNDFLQRIRKNATVVDDPPGAFSLERDTKDEKYVNLAASVSASHLVSRDKDLLDLRKGNNPTNDQFMKLCPKTQVLDPVEFLRIIRGSQQAPLP
jgi:putative PIN family toxin of toxin-antitoxin system